MEAGNRPGKSVERPKQAAMPLRKGHGGLRLSRPGGWRILKAEGKSQQGLGYVEGKHPAKGAVIHGCLFLVSYVSGLCLTGRSGSRSGHASRSQVHGLSRPLPDVRTGRAHPLHVDAPQVQLLQRPLQQLLLLHFGRFDRLPTPDSLPNAKSPRCRPSPATPVGTAAWKPRASECPASAPPALGPAGTAPRPGCPPLGSPAAAGASAPSVSSLADRPGPAAARSRKPPASCPVSAVQPLPAPTAPTASRSVPDPPPTSDRPAPAGPVRSAPAFPTAAAPAGTTPRPAFARRFCRFSSGRGSFSSRRVSLSSG